jgi:succinate dehydrogenase / fumarate reductase, membrane anchor subunit
MSVSLEAPRTKVVRKRGVNWEKWGWLYMRAYGVLLVVLIFGHLFVNLYAGEGVSAIDFGFVAGKWASPFWQWYDLALLWLALIHGANGVRTLINDYSTGRIVQPLLKWALLGSTVILLILGTLVIFTFDPCPPVGPESADLLPSFCAARP